jgi:hypothetical protein
VVREGKEGKGEGKAAAHRTDMPRLGDDDMVRSPTSSHSPAVGSTCPAATGTREARSLVRPLRAPCEPLVALGAGRWVAWPGSYFFFFLSSSFPPPSEQAATGGTAVGREGDGDGEASGKRTNERTNGEGREEAVARPSVGDEALGGWR